ncbi:hypothetical protein TcBrA4_0032110 [Trypanosoma cruzi]|nr:hypothetical protein TcBrA4_0069070 [Trypanosoma cruzi]KAF8305891.1 hypothetical protein TcBrA4_0039880 [Trypanosoma cruzi]KAF8306276.1 hypothetical protein TcBrA4_0032110 [Trypanosoma cruzi]
MDALTATGGRAMPGPASHARHNLSDGESVTTPKIEPQCTHAAKLKTQREEGQARTATLPPRETPSSAQEANAGGGRRTVRPKQHTHPFINVALLLIPRRQRVGPPRKCTLPGDGATMGSPPLGFCRPACGFWRCGNDGLTRHRTACHGRRPDVVKTGRCELCEERSPHLLRCPGSAGARTEKHGVGTGEVRSLCFTRELARFPLDAERRQARLGCGRTPMLVAGSSSPLSLVVR